MFGLLLLLAVCVHYLCRSCLARLLPSPPRFDNRHRRFTTFSGWPLAIANRSGRPQSQNTFARPPIGKTSTRGNKSLANRSGRSFATNQSQTCKVCAHRGLTTAKNNHNPHKQHFHNIQLIVFIIIIISHYKRIIAIIIIMFIFKTNSRFHHNHQFHKINIAHVHQNHYVHIIKT